MKTLLAIAFAVGVILTGSSFEKIALVDSFDFHGSAGFDIETPEGTEKVLEHVLLTGADTVLWRNMSGALPRYPSAEESRPAKEPPLDLRRLPLNEKDRGWVRWDFPKTNLLVHAGWAVGRRGKGFGIHVPLEENHGEAWTWGTWNLEHPEFWCVPKGGAPWAGAASKTHPDVMAHKLRLVDEILFDGVETVFLDLLRAGSWSPARESAPVEKVREAVTDYIRGIRARCDVTGRKIRFLIGLPHISLGENVDYTFSQCGVDWKALAADGTVDGVVLMAAFLRPGRDVWQETRDVYAHVMRNRGRAKVYFPVAEYGWNHGIPQYCQATGLSKAQVAERLMTLAAEAGADGVTLECVDYGNYTKEMCEAIKNFKTGETR